MKKFSLILLILVSHNSCSFFNSVIENNEPAPALKESNQKIFCPQDGQTPKVSMASNNLNAKDIFTETLKNIPNGDKFTTIERGILFSLLHLNIRPDTFSPSARFQLFIKNKGSWEYWDVSSPKGQYPLLYGLETIALYYGSKYSLKKMAYFIDKYAPPYFPIGPQLGNFLVKNQKELSRHKIFNDAFFKAGQILQVGESIKKLPFRKIIKKYKALPKNEYQIKSKLFDFSLTNRNDLKIKCNLDLNLYSRSIYPIRNSSNTQTSPFGVVDTKGNAFIAVTSNRYKTLSPGLETFLISGNEKSLPVSFCQIKEKTREINLFSFKGRDPAQHIYHLIEQEVIQSQNLSDLAALIAFPRHQFLLNPLRMLYESNRASKEQLQKFLGMGIPLYHSSNLGNLWALAFFKKLNTQGFVLDPREGGHLSCLN